MNSYIYPSFKQDMESAIEDFIKNTDYKIIAISDNSIRLANNLKIISFYIEATNLVSEISNIDGSDIKSIYEIFVQENKMNEYPTDKTNTFSFEEWNKYFVKKVLDKLRASFKKYL